MNLTFDEERMQTQDKLSKLMEITKREQLGTVYDKQPELLNRPRTIPLNMAVNQKEFVDYDRIYGF